MNEGHAHSRAFVRASSSPAFDWAAPLEEVDGADLTTLQAMMRHLTEELGASGSVLTCLDGEAGSTLLCSDVPADVRPAIESLCRGSSGPFAVTVPSGGDGERWSELVLDHQSWSILNIPVRAYRRQFAALALFREETQLSRAGLRALRGIRPLLTGVLTLWAAGAHLRRRVASLSCALNQSSTGIIVLDDEGTITFTNHAAERLLAKGESVRRSGASITAKKLPEALRLQVAIEHVIHGSQEDGDDPVPVVALSRGGTHRPLMVAIVGMGEDKGLARGAVLHLFDPDQDVEPLLEPVCKFYGLTPVEVRLTCLLVGGACVAEAAAKMRVKEQTARTYLKQIFAKTDVNRQTDLIRLMLTSVVPTSGTDAICLS